MEINNSLQGKNPNVMKFLQINKRFVKIPKGVY